MSSTGPGPAVRPCEPVRVTDAGPVADPGRGFVESLAAKDTDALVALFAPDVDFRGMTPGRFWEAGDPVSLVRDVLYQWFEPQDVVERVERVQVSTFVDRHRVDYAFAVRCPDGRYRVEQRAYYDVGEDGRITRMHAMCSGFRRTEGG